MIVLPVRYHHCKGGCTIGTRFVHSFDFGDDWWHLCHRRLVRPCLTSQHRSKRSDGTVHAPAGAARNSKFAA